MEIQITYLGQSGFLLRDGESNLAIDPHNEFSEESTVKIIFATHSHYDHVGRIKTILEKNPESILIGNHQVVKKFNKWQDRTKKITPNEEIELSPWRLTFIKCRHGIFSSVENTGIIIRHSSFSFGHPGDAVEFEGFIKHKLDVLAVPISGFFAASPKRVIEELRKFTSPLPEIIIPIHWVFRNPSKFCLNLSNQFPGISCKVPVDGETLKI